MGTTLIANSGCAWHASQGAVLHMRDSAAQVVLRQLQACNLHGRLIHLLGFRIVGFSVVAQEVTAEHVSVLQHALIQIPEVIVSLLVQRDGDLWDTSLFSHQLPAPTAARSSISRCTSHENIMMSMRASARLPVQSRLRDVRAGGNCY